MKFFQRKIGLMVLGGVAGLGAMLLAIYGNPGNMAFCIACFLRDSAGAMKFHTAEVVQYFRPEIVGLVLGGFVLAAFKGELRATGGSSPILRFLLGVIMMIGALVFLGCPLRMLLRMSAGDLSSYIGLIGFVVGVGTGALMVRKGFSLGRSYETRRANVYVFPILLLVLLGINIGTSLFAMSSKGPGSMHAPVLLSLVVGLVFGAIAHQTRMCFGGSFRDIFLLKDLTLISTLTGIFLTMLIYNIASGHFKFVAFGPVAHAQSLWNILGMYVVGFAAVLLSGCPLRQLILAGSGSADSAVTVIGMFVGSAICHNFGIAAAPAAAATADKAAVSGGPGLNGKIAVVVCIVLLFVIALIGIRKERVSQAEASR